VSAACSRRRYHAEPPGGQSCAGSDRIVPRWLPHRQKGGDREDGFASTRGAL